MDICHLLTVLTTVYTTVKGRVAQWNNDAPSLTNLSPTDLYLPWSVCEIIKVSKLTPFYGIFPQKIADMIGSLAAYLGP